MGLLRLGAVVAAVLIFSCVDRGYDYYYPPYRPEVLPHNTGGGAGGACSSSLVFDTGTIESPVAEPLPVTGGTVSVSNDGAYAIIAESDTPAVHVIHIARAGVVRDPSLDRVLKLEPGEWPVRPTQDKTGVIHTLLRGSGKLVSFDPRAPTASRRVSVCDQPRGIAYEPTTDALHIGCAEGALVSLRAADGVIFRQLRGPNDLRDVVIRDGELFVSRFRSTELLALVELRPGSAAGAELMPIARPLTMTNFHFSPAVAWRTVATPGGVLMMHQGARTTSVATTCSGYGGVATGSSITAPVATYFRPGATEQEPALVPVPSHCFGGALPVDLAVSADGKVAASIEAGNRRLRMLYVPTITDATFESCDPFGQGTRVLTGRPLGVAITPDGRVLVHADDATLHIFGPYRIIPAQQQYNIPASVDLSAGEARLLLHYAPRQSTGHRLFHDATGSGVACASCHPEGHDDGHVWSFNPIGPRRTQSLSGGIGNTAPFHWDGDMTTFSTLMAEVMAKRMSGPLLDAPRESAMIAFINSIPAARATSKDEGAVLRGKLLFESNTAGCTGCHSGALFTNNGTVSVGGNKAMQVPTLVGLGTRAPFMHDGCAKTLADRFDPACGGGDLHGKTSHLSAAETSDLVAYLETL